MSIVLITSMAHNATPSGAKKRSRNPDNWKQNRAKKARNSGNAYISPTTGREVAARLVGDPCRCTNQCFIKLGDEVINAIHTDFWTLGDHNLQTAFIQHFTVEHKPKRCYTPDGSCKKTVTRIYHLQVAGDRVPVCKKAFASVLSISLTRIDNALKAKTATGVLVPDSRGTHENHPRVSVETLQLVKDHINTFAVVHSHYSRYVLIYLIINYCYYIHYQYH